MAERDPASGLLWRIRAFFDAYGAGTQLLGLLSQVLLLAIGGQMVLDGSLTLSGRVGSDSEVSVAEQAPTEDGYETRRTLSFVPVTVVE